MNTIKISETKLKVMLTKEDMQNYHIEIPKISCGDALCRNAVKELIRNAGREVGLEPDGEKMFLQLYPERDGGCEIFATFLSGKNTVTADHITGTDHTTNSEDNMPKAAVGTENIRERYRPLPEIYKFRDFKDLLSLCRRLDRRKKNFYQSGGMSSLYAEREKNEYYLIIFGEECGCIAAEYGGIKKSGSSYAYINEHCFNICSSDAIETLSALC